MVVEVVKEVFDDFQEEFVGQIHESCGDGLKVVHRVFGRVHVWCRVQGLFCGSERLVERLFASQVGLECVCGERVVSKLSSVLLCRIDV